MQAENKRPYGSGSLFVVEHASGQQMWFGKWRAGGRQVKRRIGVKRPPGGREGLTRSQAEAQMRELMRNVQVMPATRGELLSVSELGGVYLADLRRRGRKPSTVTAVSSAIATHIEPFFAGRSVQSITPEDVAGLMAVMEHQGLAPKSIRNHIGTLSALLAFACRKRMLSENPARYVELPEKTTSEEIRFLDPSEVQALIRAAVDGPYQALDRALYLTAAMTGLRQGELIALPWRHVDWTAQRVRVRRNYVKGEWGTPKSKRSERSVPLADAVAGELDRLYQVSRTQGDDDLVFAHPVRVGAPLERAGILRRFRYALRGACLDETHVFHDLRHTFGTRMAGAGVPMRTLQEWMGHRDIQTTQIYADYAPSAHEADMIAQAFGTGQPVGQLQWGEIAR
jgi:integrase